MPLILTSLRNAIVALTAAQAKSQDRQLMDTMDETMREVFRSGIIQHFGCTYELAWKFMRRQLELELGRISVDGISRRDLFRLAAEQRLITRPEAWFAYHVARNETSHTYDLSVAERVYTISLDFARDAVQFLAVLETRNA
jgi:nucleotidyltransferase substrate binding protein (TIGR01987 family)